MQANIHTDNYFPKAGNILENVLYIENWMQVVGIFPLAALAAVVAEPDPGTSFQKHRIEFI